MLALCSGRRISVSSLSSEETDTSLIIHSPMKFFLSKAILEQFFAEGRWHEVQKKERLNRSLSLLESNKIRSGKDNLQGGRELRGEPVTLSHSFEVAST